MKVRALGTALDDGTRARAVRHRDRRAREAGRLLARTEWLNGVLVFWTGTPRAARRLDAFPPSVLAAAEDRLAERPPGLHVLTLSRPPSPANHLVRHKGRTADAGGGGPTGEILGLDLVTQGLVAVTARAIGAVAGFPKMAARSVGPVPLWAANATGRLDRCRRALDGVRAWRAGRPDALALEARVLWLGTGARPTSTLPERALASYTTGARKADDPGARLAAIALGQRRAAGSCDPRLAVWESAGRAMNRWSPASIARAAGDIGTERFAALAAASPVINDALGAAWADERGLDPTPMTAEELADLGTLLSAVAAVRLEPHRRHDVMRRLVSQYNRLCLTRGLDGRLLAQDEREERFRELVSREAYGPLRACELASAIEIPATPFGLASEWIGEALGGGPGSPSVDHPFAEPADAPGGTARGTGRAARHTLAGGACPGGVCDPAGEAATVAEASRLASMGVPDACGALAVWIEACRPIVPLATFWRDVAAVLPSRAEVFDGGRAPSFAASLRTRACRIAAELAVGRPRQDPDARAALSAALVRGPEAVDRVARWGLWIPDGACLDAALRFVEAAERTPTAVRFGDPIPVPHDVFSCGDAVLRNGLLELGLALWKERTLEAGTVVHLLGLVLQASGRPGATPWRSVLPRLREEARLLVRRQVERCKAQGCVSFGSAADFTFIALDVCARWAAAGFADTRRLARILSDRWPSSDDAAREWDPSRSEHNELIVLLSEGRIERLLALLALPHPSRRHEWRAADGWQAIQAHPSARAWVSAALDRTELVERVVRLLERVALIVRLEPGLRPTRLFAPLDRPAAARPPWPSWVGPAEAAMIEEVARAGGVADVPGGLPAVLQRILDGRTAMTREHEALRRRVFARLVSPRVRTRASRLGEILADPSMLDAELRRALQKALPKQRAFAGLAALEAIAGRYLQARWEAALGGGGLALDTQAWDNALLMLQTIRHNRRILRRLLQHATRGDRTWIRDLGPNRAFLERLAAAGAKTDQWLAGRSRVVDVPGNTFTAYVSTDPLEVLQMGSLFGTCLSADRFNAHAAVAAAVEVNKRVLYVRDREGRILGRQLLAVLGSGEVVGFRYYGSGLEDARKTGLRVRLALGLLALDIARASGVRLASALRVAAGLSDEDERSLQLFCEGYVDMPEPFDWWIEALAEAGSGGSEEDRARLRAMLREPVPEERDARKVSDWRRAELGHETSRALLWLGADAPSLSPDQERALGLRPAAVRRL